MRKKLLWIGDAACPSGFARATHEILNVLQRTFDIVVLGINYRGDPHEYPYPIYCAYAGGDYNGVGRFIWMLDLHKPDLVVIQNDPWNFPAYFAQLQDCKEYAHIPIIGAVAVDGKNCLGAALNQLTLAVFWTEFGKKEAIEGGYTGLAEVIPLGVNLDVYHPMDKYEARLNRGLPRSLDDTFIVGNINRNQFRKRWDLTCRYFATWVKEFDIKDAMLFLHTAPTGETSIRVKELMQYYGVVQYLALVEPPVFYGVAEMEMAETYNCFDVQVSTTQGEGFGLTTLEGMACGVPQIVPDWSGLHELCKDAAWFVPCPNTCVGPPFLNVLGGVADEEIFIRGLQRMYVDKAARAQNGQAALERAQEDRFRWEKIGERWTETLQRIVQEVLV